MHNYNYPKISVHKKKLQLIIAQNCLLTVLQNNWKKEVSAEKCKYI